MEKPIRNRRALVLIQGILLFSTFWHVLFRPIQLVCPTLTLEDTSSNHVQHKPTSFLNNNNLSKVYPKILPQTLYIIYGLESSGTTLVAKTIASALGVSTSSTLVDYWQSDDRSVHVQHISLPTGWVTPDGWDHELQYSEPLPTIPVFYPPFCQVPPNRLKPPFQRPFDANVREACQEIVGMETGMTLPNRYFIDISSHIQWYQQRGVQVYPILVIRDTMLHFHGIVQPSGHCPNQTAAYQQFLQGRQLLVESLSLHPTLVSYEAFMFLQRPYWSHLCHQLGIKNAYFAPKLISGNTKYLKRSNNGSITSTQSPESLVLARLDEALMEEDERAKKMSVRNPVERQALLSLVRQHSSKNLPTP